MATSAPRARPVDVSGRPTDLRHTDLDAFFQPQVVAVIGASDTEGRPTTAMWRKLAAWGAGAGARVLPVNPSRAQVDGQPCLATIDDIDGPVDLAAILVADAVTMFASLASKAPRFAVIFSAGFAEAGAAGAAQQAQLEALVAASTTRLLGPNTNLNAFELFRDDLPGRSIALITQSGHQGRPVFEAQDLGVKLSHWAPTGNEVDLEFADFAGYFAEQEGVGAIAAYIEGFKDGRSMMLAADRAAGAQTPIVMVKVGRTAAGASMARSHTGHLTGSDAVTDAVFRQFGITRVDGLDELTDTSAMFARTVAPKGTGVCVYSISGGTGAHMADLCAAAGLALPPLSDRTQGLLHQWIPAYLRVSNPVDNGGPPSSDARGRKILDTILADPAVDVLICPITGAVASLSVPLATDLVAAAATTDKPVFVVWGSPDGADPAYAEILLQGQIPVFRTFRNCVQAAKAYFDYWEFQRRHSSPFAEVPTRPFRGAATVAGLVAPLAGGEASNEHDAKSVLRAYGIPTTRDVLCGSASEAARAAAALGFPVVAKVASPDILHKSDVGLVRTGLRSGAEVQRAYRELTAAARAAAGARAQIDGILVCEQVDGGVECVLGVSRDELFGPVVMFGLGGVFVEILGDVTFRVPPFSKAEAHRMVREVAGFAMLEGARGAPPADVPALVDAVMRVQRLALDHADTIAEVDINPLLVRPKGAGVVALDALVIGR